jgi:malonate-semialdehyde dehydrogenase (acetylating) / methylmalonate-semialdehyde dehydrogenase
MALKKLQNYINGEWVPSSSSREIEVINPATAQAVGIMPLSTLAEADQAIEAAQAAFPEWRRTPPITRARYLFRLKEAMEEAFEELSELVTVENGKTLDEARGEVRRAIENVEVGTSIPSLLMGYNAEDVAQDIDEEALRQPIGVFTMLAPFNFPAMVPWWFLPYAIACGDTFVIKPSRQTPMTANRLYEICDEIMLPPGVINLVNGTHDVADRLMDHRHVRGVSFVGSTRAARHVYSYSAEHGKRVQAQGGAKNFLVIMPDADVARTVQAIMTSGCGCAGQRCLAGSNLICIGGIEKKLVPALAEAMRNLKVGNGLERTTQMGPVISAESKAKIIAYIDGAIKEGATALVDGRGLVVPGYEKGFFVGPTLLDNLTNDMTIAKEEVFGPVMGIMKADSLQQSIDMIHENPHGNAASIFTSNGGTAREFKYSVFCGNIGINIGIAAPMATFPFGGMKDSFFGDLHGQGRDGIEFYTDRKVVISRWF